jgi:hypothetical protein
MPLAARRLPPAAFRPPLPPAAAARRCRCRSPFATGRLPLAARRCRCRRPLAARRLPLAAGRPPLAACRCLRVPEILT